jgi:pseudaminic acid synthase
MSNSIKLGNKIIGENSPCYIIAEMSANHAGSIDRAIDIIQTAKECGADCIKIQTYTPDTMTIDSDKEYFQIKEGTWKGENLYSLYGKAYTPWEWQGKLKEEAEKIGLDFLSTPFDKTSVDFLEELGVAFYKIASFELTDIPLIKYVASKGKPIIMSTGMGTLGEIEEAVNAIKSQGNTQICLLKCSSAYPAIPDDMNLKTIKNMSEIFNVPVGLSDHSLGHIGAVTAVAMGAKVIEKHFCISRDIENPDASFSMEPGELKEMVESIRIAERAIGKISYDISEKEAGSRIFRRSIFAVKDIAEGEMFTEKNIRVIRPGNGLEPKYYESILGKTAQADISEGTPLKWSSVD